MDSPAPNQSVIVVLTGGITQDNHGNFVPTSYEDSDQFGMLGGQMRNNAAISLFLAGKASEIVFIGGKGKNSKSPSTYVVPSSAEVYRENFLSALNKLRPRVGMPQGIDFKPKLLAIELSSNTTENIKILISKINELKWKDVIVISNRYHIPRVKKLFELQNTQANLSSVVVFLSAEEVLLETCPGVYDEQIQKGYSGKAASQRIANERLGLQDLQDGTYNSRK